MALSLLNSSQNSLNWVPKLITLLLMAVLIWIVAIVSAQSLQTTVNLEQPVLQKTAEVNVSSKPSIVNISLFGSSESKPSKVKEAEKPVIDSEVHQVTKLNLTLNGIVKTPKKSVAIVESGVKTSVVTVGESILPNVDVESIQRDRIVINNKGKLETLYLVGIDPDSFKNGKGVEVVALDAKNKEKLETIRTELKNAPLSINRYVRFKTLNANGVVSALQVWPRRDRKIFEALGFKSGDKITSINGKPIADMMANPQSSQDLLKMTAFDLDIERNGQLTSLNVSLN